MIKKIIKILSIILLIVTLFIFYLSFIGIKTEKFNERIKNKVLEIDKKISLDLHDVKFLLNPFNFTGSIATSNPTILFEGNKLQIKNIKTKISLRSLIFNEFSIDELQISTKAIKLNDLISLTRSFKNSTGLFLLNSIIKDGSILADINLKFNDNGTIKNNYQLNGFVTNIKFNLLNQYNVRNLNFEFDIRKDKYLLKKLKTDFNNIKLSSPSIEIDQEKNLFLVKGKILSNEKEFDTSQISDPFVSLIKNVNIEKIRFNSESDFSFNISKKLKLNNLTIKSKIKLDELVIKNRLINLDPYMPNLRQFINFENHKVVINYVKDKFEIKGGGDIFIEDKPDYINYQISKSKDELIFDTKTKLKNSKLLISFLDYEKKENLESEILIKGSYKKDNSIKFDLISLVEKDNKILFKNLHLTKNFKIISVDMFNFDYLNNKRNKNQLFLNKNNSNYLIDGIRFDATKLINMLMDGPDGNSSIFKDFNSTINLFGIINYKNNKIDALDLKATFPNDKEINLSIETNNQQEKITKLFTTYPKPLIKRYDFIKGFEEGNLDFHSVKRNGSSNSLLIIDNFKVKEVPVFAKLLSLASLQGIADLLTGEGIRFTDLEMNFSNQNGLTTIKEMYAIGPAVSILMDGYIQSKELISLRGTLVPATTINRSIASIPLLGKILIGEKTGEGIFGVSFKIKGSPKNLKTSVNPIKTLTPRFITRTLEKIKKN